MDTQVFYVQPKPSKTAPVRALFRESAARMGKGSNLLYLILSMLLCAVLAYTIYLTSAVVNEVLYAFTLLAVEVIDLICLAWVLLGAICLLLPLLVGRVRMAGMIAAEREVSLTDLFYYFSTGKRYGRGVLLGILYALSLSAPMMLTAASFGIVSYLFTNVLLYEMKELLAVLAVIPLYALCALFGVLCLFLSGIWLPGVAIGIGKEEVNPFHAFGLGLRAGCAHLGACFRFSWRVLLHALLSLFTVGVLWMLYSGQLTTVAYMRFSEKIQTE